MEWNENFSFLDDKIKKSAVNPQRVTQTETIQLIHITIKGFFKMSNYDKS